jgi:hypothetical protein
MIGGCKVAKAKETTCDLVTVHCGFPMRQLSFAW